MGGTTADFSSVSRSGDLPVEKRAADTPVLAWHLRVTANTAWELLVGSSVLASQVIQLVAC